MRPSHDRNSDKYPDRVFYGSRWCTPEQIEGSRRRQDRHRVTEKRRAYLTRYNATEKGRASSRAAVDRYQATLRGYITQRRRRIAAMREHHTNRLEELNESTTH